MEYNKKDFQKMNDKKVLHKVRKHWVVVSLAMLMALGGTAVATHVSANADSTTSNNNNAQSNTQTPKENQSQSLVKPANQNASAQSNNQAQLNNAQPSVKTVTNAASQLHQRILNNAAKQPVAPQVAAPKVNQSADSVLGNRLNMNMRKQALTNQHFTRNLGLSGQAGQQGGNSGSSQLTAAQARYSTLIVHYEDVSDNMKQINEKSTVKLTDPSTKFSDSQYFDVLPQGYVTADFNKSKAQTGTGYTFNGQKFNDSSDPFENAGQNNMYIYVHLYKQPQNGAIRVNYVDSSDNNTTVNSIALSDTPTTMFTASDLEQYLQTPPDGYQINNWSVTGSGASAKYNGTGDVTFNNNHVNSDDSFSEPYGSQVNTLNISVSAIPNPNSPLKYAFGTITYENADNGNAFVSSRAFKESLGNSSSDDLKNKYAKELPSGYKLLYSDSTKPSYKNNFSADNSWQNGDNDIIYVIPSGTDLNIPKAASDASFITVDYKNMATNKVISQKNLTGTTSGNGNNFVSTNFTNPSDLPTNYHSVGPAVYSAPAGSTFNGTQFPTTPGTTYTMTVPVQLNSDVDPTSGSYNPNTANKVINRFATLKFEYVNTATGQVATVNNQPMTDGHGRVIGTAVPETTVSDVPVGTVINYAPYITSIPSGYTYAGMGSHEANAESGVVDPNANASVKNPVPQFNVDPDANVIYVSPINTTSQPVYVNYYNQYGVKLTNTGRASDPTVVFNKDLDFTLDNITANDGENLNAGYASNPTLNTVPAGYSIVPGQKLSTVVSNNKQEIPVLVMGQPLNHPITVKSKKVNSDGTTSDLSKTVNAVKLPDVDRTVSDTPGVNSKAYTPFSDVVENPVAGQQITFYPSSSDPDYTSGSPVLQPSGYQANSGQKPVTYEITPTGSYKLISDGIPKDDTTPANFHYNLLPGADKNATQQKVQPISVTFINQRGKILGGYNLKASDTKSKSTDPITGAVTYGVQDKAYSTPVNIVNPYNDATSLIPKGYHLANNDQQNVFYQFTDSGQTINILLNGTSVTAGTGSETSDASLPKVNGHHLADNQLLVKLNLYSDGGVTHKQQVVSVNGQIGDSYSLNPKSVLTQAGALTSDSLTSSDALTAAEQKNHEQTLLPSEYQPKGDQNDQTYTNRLDSDGALATTPEVSDHTVNYDYQKQNGTINIEYYNGSSKVGSDQVKGQFGSSFTDVANMYETKLMPTGYSFANGVDYISNAGNVYPSDTPSNFTPSDNNSVFKIKVNSLATMYIQYVDKVDQIPNVKKIQIAGPSDTNFFLDNSGIKGHNSKYLQLVPAGYQLANTQTPSDSIESDTIRPDGQQLTWTNGHVIKIDVTKDPNTGVSTNLGTINIHYMDTSDGDQVDEIVTNSDVSHGFTYSDYTNSSKIPQGYILDPNEKSKDKSSLTQYASGINDAYVYVKRDDTASIDPYSHDTVQYININHNPSSDGVLATVPATGKTGTPIDYQNSFEQVLPAGYEFVALGNATKNYESTPDGKGINEQILVGKPANEFGHVKVNYYLNTYNYGTGKWSLPSDLSPESLKSVTPVNTLNPQGKNGDFFGMSNYENSTPKSDNGTQYLYQNSKVFDDNGQSISNNEIDNFDGGTQTLNIAVYKPAVAPAYNTIYVVYHDTAATNARPDIVQKVNAQVGDLFDATDIEHRSPEGSRFIGLNSGSMPIPTRVPGYKQDNTGAWYAVDQNGNKANGYHGKNNYTLTFDVSYKAK